MLFWLGCLHHSIFHIAYTSYVSSSMLLSPSGAFFKLQYFSVLIWSVLYFLISFLKFSLKWSELAQLCPTLCDPRDCSLPGSSLQGILPPWDFPGKSTGVGCHFLLQGIFLTQGLNPDLPHSRQTLNLWATREALGPYKKLLLADLLQWWIITQT